MDFSQASAGRAGHKLKGRLKIARIYKRLVMVRHHPLDSSLGLEPGVKRCRKVSNLNTRLDMHSLALLFREISVLLIS
jgi:hypothetical protein